MVLPLTRRLALGLLASLALAASACGGDGDSPTGPTGGGGGGSSCSRPAAPGNLAASVSFSSVAFTWSAVGGANDYLIMVGTTPGSSNALSTNTTQTTYSWNGVPRGTYYARVEARNACGSGAASAQITFAIA